MKDPILRAELRKTMERLGVQTVNTITPDMIICCSRLEGFDFERDLATWSNEEAISAPSPYECGQCQESIVMSRWTRRHVDALNSKPTIVCPVCLKEGLDNDKY